MTKEPRTLRRSLELQAQSGVEEPKIRRGISITDRHYEAMRRTAKRLDCTITDIVAYMAEELCDAE